MGLTELARISREYGKDERFVLAGGGNTSFKDEQFLYIKASGFSLATITEDGFAKMVRADLNRIWSKRYPEDTDERESVALEDLMNARAKGEDKRPSVETLLHEAIPDAYVVHTHPALVNGLTCSRDGEKAAQRLFGDDALWVPVVNPGYVLAVTVKRAMDKYQDRTGHAPAMILLQNHGVFASADEPTTVRAIYDRILAALSDSLKETPDLSPVEVPTERVHVVESALRRDLLQGAGGFGGSTATSGPLYVEHEANTELLRLLENRGSFAAVSSAYTPDHFVYCGEEPLYFETDDRFGELLPGELTYYRERHGRDPKIVAVGGLGIFGCEHTEKGATNAVRLFIDAARIAVYARSFGGYRFLPEDQLAFLRGWEVERYRASVSTKEENT